MFIALIALVIVFSWWAPQSWLGRKLNGAVARVERRLAAVPPTAWMAFWLGMVALTALILYGKFDGAIMAGMAAPEVLSTIASIDVGIGIEMLVAAWMIGTRSRWGATAAVARIVIRRIAARIVRSPRPRRLKSAANDDEPGGMAWRGLAFAA